MTNKDFSYYYSRKDEENKIEPLGRIPLQYIYSVIALNEREKGKKL